MDGVDNMSLTVADVLKFSDATKEIVVLAGSKGLSRQIKDVLIMESPDGHFWVKSGDFLISSGFSFKNNIKSLNETIRILNEKNAASLVIKTGRFIDSVPTSALRLANQLNFPLLEMPFEMGYRELTWPIMRIIIQNEESSLLLQDKFRTLLWQAYSERHNIDEVLNLVCSHSGKTLLLLDSRLDTIKYLENPKHNGCYENIEPIIQQVENIILGKENEVFKVAGIEGLVFIIRTADEILGYFCVISDKEIEEEVKKAMPQCLPYLTIFMLEYNKKQERSVFTKEDFMIDLLFGNYLSKSQLERGARTFNLDFGLSYMVMVFQQQGTINSQLSKSKASHFISEIGLQLRLKHRLEFIQKDGHLIVLYPFDKSINYVSLKKEMLKAYNTFIEMIQCEYPKIEFYMGAGGLHSSLFQIHKNYHEALISLKFGPSIYGSEEKTYFFNDLKLFHTLFLFKDHSAMVELYNDTVKKLKDYDAERSTELVKTLLAYFNSNHSIKIASDNLYVHRNTFYKRMAKISEITGMSLTDNTDGHLLLQLALKLDSIYSLESTGKTTN